ncbi:MAG: hypothetical protein AABN33_05455 [Acidobacteriota bacterium]
MKFVYATLFLILVVAPPTFSQRTHNDTPGGDTSDRRSMNGFGGRLIVVENPREFL